MTKSESKEILKQALELYNNGDRQRAIDLLMNDRSEILPIFVGDEMAEAQKTVGLSFYYIAIKDFREIEDKKISIHNSRSLPSQNICKLMSKQNNIQKKTLLSFFFVTFFTLSIVLDTLSQ